MNLIRYPYIECETLPINLLSEGIAKIEVKSVYQ